MSNKLVPIFRVADAQAAATWYERLGFAKQGEYRHAPGLPLYMFLRRGEDALHLSEHEGDARPNTLVYLYVDDVEPFARPFRPRLLSSPGRARSTSPTPMEIGFGLDKGQDRTTSALGRQGSPSKDLRRGE